MIGKRGENAQIQFDLKIILSLSGMLLLAVVRFKIPLYYSFLLHKRGVVFASQLHRFLVFVDFWGVDVIVVIIALQSIGTRSTVIDICTASAQKSPPPIPDIVHSFSHNNRN